MYPADYATIFTKRRHFATSGLLSVHQTPSGRGLLKNDFPFRADLLTKEDQTCLTELPALKLYPFLLS